MADTEQPGSRRPKLAWYHLIGVTFFAVCGGDYGIEDAVGAAGAAYTLAGLVLLPWIWSMPIAMMTAELSSMIPEAGGYVVWIHRAFGPFWAHQNAMWNLVSNTFDNALYPVMFADYLRYFPLLRLGGVARYVVSLTMLGCVTGLNLLGVDVIASASSLFAIFVISPFAVLAVAGLPSLDTDVWFEPVGHSVRWGTFLSVLLWNTSGYDSVGALAAEVRHPGFDFPVAMVVTISLITLVYVIPLSVAVSMDEPNLPKWTDGHFTRVASEHVGEWLSAWIAIGGALSALGLLNTLLCTGARVAASSARLGVRRRPHWTSGRVVGRARPSFGAAGARTADGGRWSPQVLPRFFSRIEEPSGVPRRATLAISLLLAFACALPFAELVSISMLFYASTTLLEFLSLVQLRRTEPNTPRPFRLPLEAGGLLIACLPPMALCILLITLAPPSAWVFFLGSTSFSLFTYYARRRCERDAQTAKPTLPGPATAHQQQPPPPPQQQQPPSLQQRQSTSSQPTSPTHRPASWLWRMWHSVDLSGGSGYGTISTSEIKQAVEHIADEPSAAAGLSGGGGAGGQMIGPNIWVGGDADGVEIGRLGGSRRGSATAPSVGGGGSSKAQVVRPPRRTSRETSCEDKAPSPRSAAAEGSHWSPPARDDVAGGGGHTRV